MTGRNMKETVMRRFSFTRFRTLFLVTLMMVLVFGAAFDSSQCACQLFGGASCQTGGVSGVAVQPCNGAPGIEGCISYTGQPSVADSWTVATGDLAETDGWGTYSDYVVGNAYYTESGSFGTGTYAYTRRTLRVKLDTVCFPNDTTTDVTMEEPAPSDAPTAPFGLTVDATFDTGVLDCAAGEAIWGRSWWWLDNANPPLSHDGSQPPICEQVKNPVVGTIDLCSGQ